MRRLNVLFVSHGSSLGGAERVLLELLDGLDRERVSPVLVLVSDGPLAAAARAREVPVIVHPASWWLPFKEHPHPGYFFRQSWEQLPDTIAPLVTLIGSRGIDVVYSCSSPILHAAVAAHVARRPHVQHMQDLLGPPHVNFHMPLGSARLAYRLIGLLSTLVVCVGSASRRDVGRTIPARKMRVVPLGFRTPDATSPFPLPDAASARVKVGLAGTIDPQKGSGVIGSIVQRVAAVRPDVHFYWAGKGAPDLIDRLTHEGTVANVPHLHFVGHLEQIGPFMASIDLLLHPARNETFPRVLIEAGLMRRPVVTTRCGGGEEIVRDCVTGRLAPVDDAGAMAEAILQLADDPAERSRMGEAARALAAGLDMDTFCAAMERALLDAEALGPAIRGRYRHALATWLLYAPSRIDPRLRVYASRTLRHLRGSRARQRTGA